MDFIKIKTLALKKILRTMEQQVTNWEKIHAHHMVDKQLTSRIYKEHFTFGKTSKKRAKGRADSSPRSCVNAAVITT